MFHLKLNAYGINLLTVLPVNAGGGNSRQVSIDTNELLIY